MRRFKVRYVVNDGYSHKTMMEKINADSIEEANEKAENLAKIRSNGKYLWSVKCVEEC